jgi:hypothetical protein
MAEGKATLSEWVNTPTQTADDVVGYFRRRLPAMLDGALMREGDRGLLLRRARQSLREGRTDPKHLPMEILRETLETVTSAPAPKTMAGAVPVGPHHARVWWDERVLDSLDDVLAHLQNPRLVLRFYDITGLDPEAGRWHETFDLDVELAEAGRTVQFWSADRSYAVDLGYVHADGRFLRLARTNTIDLPRDGKGETGADTATSRLRRADGAAARRAAPDAAARDWAARRPDHERRDWDAELVVHMLYRAFLLDGPRALRRIPAFARRDSAALRQEFARRQRRVDAAAKPGTRAPASRPALLVERLDTNGNAAAAPAVTHAPVAAVRAGLSFGLSFAAPDCGMFAWHETLLRAARAERAVATPLELAAPAARVADSVPHIRVAGAEIPAALFAMPVFEAARKLRESLANLRNVDDAVRPGLRGVRAGITSPRNPRSGSSSKTAPTQR